MAYSPPYLEADRDTASQERKETVLDSDSGGQGQDGEGYAETLAGSPSSGSAALMDGIAPGLRANTTDG